MFLSLGRACTLLRMRVRVCVCVRGSCVHSDVTHPRILGRRGGGSTLLLEGRGGGGASAVAAAAAETTTPEFVGGGDAGYIRPAGWSSLPDSTSWCPSQQGDQSDNMRSPLPVRETGKNWVFNLCKNKFSYRIVFQRPNFIHIIAIHAILKKNSWCYSEAKKVGLIDLFSWLLVGII